MKTSRAPRRAIQYASLSELLADAEAAVARNATTTGNWTLGQILDHIAIAMDSTIDGFGFTAPWPIRIVGRYVLKKRMLQNGMPAGFRLRGEGAKRLVPPQTSSEAGLEHLRRSIARLHSETRRAPHPAFGPLSLEECDQLHLRHAELHMSFIAP